MNRINKKDIINMPTGERYQLMELLRKDCDYYIRLGKGEEELWAGSVDKQVEVMRKLLESIARTKRPEWLTFEDIEDFEVRMRNKITE